MTIRPSPESHRGEPGEHAPPARSGPSDGAWRTVGRVVRAIGTTAAFVGLAVLLGFVLWTQWVGDLTDFDTDELILLATTGQAPRADNAHAWSLFHHAAFALADLLGSALLGWRVAVGLAIVVTAGLLLAVARTAGASWLVATLPPGIYLASPCVFDLARRTEENFGFHPLFVLVVWGLIGDHHRPGMARGREGALAVAAAALAVTHLQPFLILSGAYVVHVLAPRLRGTRTGSAWRSIGAVVVVPALVYATTLWLGARAWVNYQQQYYSCCTAPDLARYVDVFVSTGIGYLAAPFDAYYFAADDVHPGAMGLLLAGGYAGLAGLLVWSGLGRQLPHRLLGASVLFVLLYEPTSSERWDCVVLSLALTVATQPTIAAAWFTTALLAVNLYGFVERVAGVQAAAAFGHSSYAAIPAGEVIHFEWGHVRSFVRRLPTSVQLRELGDRLPPVGGLVAATAAAVQQRDHGEVHVVNLAPGIDRVVAGK